MPRGLAEPEGRGEGGEKVEGEQKRGKGGRAPWLLGGKRL